MNVPWSVFAWVVASLFGIIQILGLRMLNSVSTTLKSQGKDIAVIKEKLAELRGARVLESQAEIRREINNLENRLARMENQ